MSGGKHADDDTDGVINRLDPDAAAYEGPATPTVDELGEVHWSPSDFTGEWAHQHALELAPRAAARAAGLTAETLRAAMGGPLSLDRYRELLPAFSRFLIAADCLTPRRAAMAFAQTGHEAVGLRYQREIWGPSAQQRKYEPGTDLARQLGNTVPGDGYRFRGAGWLQVTGRGNFTRVSRWAFDHRYVPSPTFFVDNPDLLGDDRFVWLGPAWYWTVARPDINALCDRGDLETVTRRINGGLTGLDDRRRRWNACLALGAALLPAAPATAPAPRAPGGIETMAFTDQFVDWAGNKQTVQSWMDHVDQRLFQLGKALVDPSIPSPVDGQRRAAGSYLADIGDIERRMGELDQKLDRIIAALPK